MNRISLAALVAVIASPALAADLGGHTTSNTFDVPVAGASLTNWSGVYISGSLGRNSTSHDVKGESSESSAKLLDDLTYVKKDTYVQTTGTIDNTACSATVPCYATTKPASTETYTTHLAGSPAPTGTPASMVTSVKAGDPFPPGDMGDALLANSSSSVGYTVDAARYFTEDLTSNGTAKGFTGALGLGYDQQIGRMVVGIMGDYQFRNAKSTINDVEFTQSDAIFLGGRIGVLPTGNMLVYALGGYTWLNHDGIADKLRTANDFAKDAKYTSTYGDGSFGGFTLGGGAEFPLAKGLFLGVEGRHTWYGKETLMTVSYDDAVTHEKGVRTVTDEPSEWYVGATLKLKLNTGDLGGSLK